MNKRVYRSVNGKEIDMDSLRLVNEHSIAVGNMKVNARGDELGPGGKILRTREDVLADRMPPAPSKAQDPNKPVSAPSKAARADTPVQQAMKQPAVPVEFPDDVDEQEPYTKEELALLGVAEDIQVGPEPKEDDVQENSKMRGSLAASVAGTKTVTQTLEKDPRKPDGPQRMK